MSEIKTTAIRLIAPGVLIVFAGAAIWRSSLLGVWKHSGPGAGLFPLVISCGLLFFAALWLYEKFVSSETPIQLPGLPGLLRVCLQLGALVLFAVLFASFGYIAVAAGLAVATAIIAGERGWVGTVLIALVASFGVKFFFAALGTPL